MDGSSIFFLSIPMGSLNKNLPGRASAAPGARSAAAPETRGTAEGHEVQTGEEWLVVVNGDNDMVNNG